MRKQGLEQMIVQTLEKEAAAKEGKSEEEFLKANIDAKLPAPSEPEIQKVFDENKSQMPPGSTIESMRAQIVSFLQQDSKRQVAQKLFSELRSKAKVEVLLSEPRVTVEAKGPSKGAADAKVTIVEFSDFQCPFCSKAEPAVDEVMKNYSDKVRVVFRHFPLDFHDKAFKAAEAAGCAEDQGKFWEFHKTLFANQGALSIDDLKAHAKTLGLDSGKFNECLDSGKMKAKVDGDMAAARAVGVNGTPAFFINGIVISGAQPYDKFKEIIDSELAR
jgi:protein-disulfide isomerase